MEPETDLVSSYKFIGNIQSWETGKDICKWYHWDTIIKTQTQTNDLVASNTIENCNLKKRERDGEL